MPRLSNPFLPARQPSAPATPWGQKSLAWVNGHVIYGSLTQVPVRRRTPRTQFITLTRAGCAV